MTELFLEKRKNEISTFSFNLTDRDIQILLAINSNHILKLSQIQRALLDLVISFRSLKSRIKKLLQNKLIKKVTFYQDKTSATETAYSVTKLGFEALCDYNSDQIYLECKSKVKKRLFNKLVTLNDFKLSLEQEIEQLEHYYIDNFVPMYELRNGLKSYINTNSFKNYSQFKHHINNKEYSLFPAAIFVIRYGKHKRLFFLDIDETNSMQDYRDKLIAYNLYVEQGFQEKYGDFKANQVKVLFFTNSEQKSQKIKNALLFQEGHQNVRIANQHNITGTNLLSEPFWLKTSNERVSIIN